MCSGVSALYYFILLGEGYMGIPTSEKIIYVEYIPLALQIGWTSLLNY